MSFLEYPCELLRTCASLTSAASALLRRPLFAPPSQKKKLFLKRYRVQEGAQIQRYGKVRFASEGYRGRGGGGRLEDILCCQLEHVYGVRSRYGA
jgi:hypothetical protein